MNVPTLLREAEHKALAQITLTGTVLDLGGDARAEYRSLIGGEHTYTTVNMDEKARPDIVHDLEKPLPIEDASYDHAVLMNVLEHIYNYRQLLQETARVIRPGGSVIIVVPFLFPIHPSPSDFWRFSRETLERECRETGFMVRCVKPLGSGIFAAQYVMIDRLLPGQLRLLSSFLVAPVVKVLDGIFEKIAEILGKSYRKESYALGYVVSAMVK